MSFPRAAIKRFNEPADSSIPPPGTYDPKFVTDVAAVASTLKGSGGGGTDKWGRPPLSTTYGLFGAAGASPGFTGVTSKRSRSFSVGAPTNVNELVKTSRSRFAFNKAVAVTHSGTRISRKTSSIKLSRNASAAKLVRNASSAKLGRNASSAKLSKRSSSSGMQAGMSYPESLMLMTKTLGRTNTRHSVGSRGSKSGILKSPSPCSIRTHSGIQRAPSSSSFIPFTNNQDILTDTMKAEAWNATSTVNSDKLFEANNRRSFMKIDAELEPGEVIMYDDDHQSPPRPSPVSFLRRNVQESSGNIFDEIQTLAESLQNELSEYKQKLAKERNRSQELDAKKLELEFINQSYKRQLEKYENDKASREVGELNSRFKLEEITKEKDDVQWKLDDLQRQLEGVEESKVELQKKVVHLEEEKLKMQKETEEFLEVIQGSKQLLKDEQKKRGHVEDKIRQLETQMETCYHSCESRMAETENMKDTYEVKIQELTDQVADLHSKLEESRREMETQKMLMELMKGEQVERNNNNVVIIKDAEVDEEQKKAEEESKKFLDNVIMDNYIS